VAVLLFTALAVRVSAAPAAMVSESGSASAREVVMEALRAWDRALVGEDVPRLLGLYVPSDSLLIARIEESARALTALDTLTCVSRLSTLRVSGGTMDAVVFRRITHREHGRDQASVGWNTVRFVATNDGWRIGADDDRVVARTSRTDLRVRLLPDEGKMEGEAVVRIEVAEPGADNILLGLNRGLNATGIRNEDGRDLPFERVADAIIIGEPAPLRVGETRVLTIDFEGSLFNEARENGYSQVSIAPEGCFASWVTSWYPHLVGPGSKSTGTIVFDVPAGLTVAASGRPVARAEHAGREEQSFEVRQPVDFSFGAAGYFHREDTVDGVAVGIYLLDGGEEKASFYLPALARILRFERDFYGGYPFDNYSIVEIPSEAAGTLGGSSEQGMNLFPVGQLPADRIPLPLIAHEMGHSWWGNLVQGKDGSILDEALAQMTAVMAIREIEGEEAMRSFLHRGRPEYRQSAEMYFQYSAGRADRDIPIASAQSGSAQGALLHELADTKGHFVYDMLRETIGDEAFVEGLRSAVKKFAMKEMRLRDLQEEWEAASRRELDTFFRQWFYRSGAPDLSLRYEVARADGAIEVRGVVSQSGEPYALRVEVAALRGETSEDRSERHEIEITKEETPFSFRVSALPDTVVLDPRYKILRWTDEYRDHDLLSSARRLRSAGRADSAVALLTADEPRVPGGIAGLYLLGLCHQDRNDLVEAERFFRRAFASGRRTRSDDPAVILSALHLGQVMDLAGRRDEAKRWYAEVLASPDVQSSHVEARAGLAAPFTATPRAERPDPKALAALIGSYEGGGGMKIRVVMDADSTLSAGFAGTPLVPIEWKRELEFRAGEDGAVRLLFSNGTPSPALDIEINGRAFRLERVE